MNERHVGFSSDIWGNDILLIFFPRKKHGVYFNFKSGKREAGRSFLSFEYCEGLVTKGTLKKIPAPELALLIY